MRRVRRALPAGAWLVLALGCFVAAWLTRPVRSPEPARVATVQPDTSVPAVLPAVDEVVDSAEPPDVARPPGLPAALGSGPGASGTPVPTRPRAGRQVLRCELEGRVTYLDTHASCAEGRGELVTVFPTQGVGRPR